MSSFSDALDRYFGITAKGSTLGTEVRGGIITFLSMVYILAVNPSILSAGAPGYTLAQLFTATALSAIIACLLMGLYARFPVALAPGMGLNAFLSYTVCLVMGFTFEQGLLIVFISGLIFFLITVSGLRERIINSLPRSMKVSISVGIGFFIMVLALFNSGIITHATGSALQLGNLADPGVLLALFCVITTISLYLMRKWYAVFLGMILTWIIGNVLSAAGITSATGTLPSMNFSEVVTIPDTTLFLKVFTGFGMFADTLWVSFIAALISLVVIDMFDTTGTLLTVGSAAGQCDEDGNLKDGGRALQADAVASMTGAVCGTCTTTSFIESLTGIAAGAKTGLMPVVVGLLFIVAMFFSPFFLTFTSACTVGALMMVGILLFGNLSNLTWDDPVDTITAAITIFLMGLTGSITNGIAFGAISYVICYIAIGKAREIPKMVWGLAGIFLLYFVALYAI